jgi:ATP-dependent Clp protease ATP-binding subunit ClpC
MSRRATSARGGDNETSDDPTQTHPTGLDDQPTFQRRRQRTSDPKTGNTSVELTDPDDESLDESSAGFLREDSTANTTTDTTSDDADDACQTGAEALDTSDESSPSLGDRLFGGNEAVSKPEPADEPLSWHDANRAANPDQQPDSQSSVETAPPEDDLDDLSDDDPSATESGPAHDSAYALDPEVYPTLCEFGRNLTLEAAQGETDPVIGRDEEIIQLIDILGKRRTNNPLLVGEPGVGKTAIVEGLANRFVDLAQQGSAVGGRTIVELELGRLLSGTQLRGAFSERLLNIKDEMVAADGDVIVFLDEIHAWMDAGGSDGADATSELKTALARGQFPCIGATTNDEYREFIEVDPAFDRRFEVCRANEPSADETVDILRGLRDQYESHHHITYDDDALSAAVDYSQRYIHDQRLPDKALGLIDLAGSRARRLGDDDVDRARVAEVVSRLRNVPVDRLLRSDRQRFLNCADELGDTIIGQDHVIESVAEVLQRNYAGFRGERPIGSLLFMGPTGVGKTEMVKALADFLFDDRDAIVQMDMSEYMQSHSVSRFVGAPPGYVGFDEGGQLTEEIRHRPYQVVLLDEIEKAHRDVLNVLLQVFEEGRLTDGRGRPVDFSNTLIVMTSNLGADAFSSQATDQDQPIGFGTARREPQGADDSKLDADTREEVISEARQHFTPELWNRLDERLVFHPLSREDVADIARLQLEESADRLEEDSQVTFEAGNGVVDYLIDAGGFDPDLGARPMRETIRREVEGMIARAILEGNVGEGDALKLEVHGEELGWQKLRRPDHSAPTMT